MRQQLIIIISKLLIINISLVIGCFTDDIDYLSCKVISTITFTSLMFLSSMAILEHFKKITILKLAKYLNVLLTFLALFISLISQYQDKQYLDLLTVFVVGQIYKDRCKFKCFDTQKLKQDCVCTILVLVFGEIKIFKSEWSKLQIEFWCWQIFLGVLILEQFFIILKGRQFIIAENLIDDLSAQRNNQYIIKKHISATMPLDDHQQSGCLYNIQPQDEIIIPPRKKDMSSLIVLEGQKADKKQFFKALLNQMPDGIAIIELVPPTQNTNHQDYNLEFFSQSLLQILDADTKKQGLQILMDLENCLEQYEEQERFNQLFEKLNVKLLINPKNSSNTLNSIKYSSQSKSLTVKEELDNIMKDMVIQIGLRRQKKQTEKQKISFLLDVKMICQTDTEENNEGGRSDKKKLLQIIFKAYIQFERPYILIIVKNVTMFNEINVLQQINQNKSKMLAQVAHEFRTPLNGIILLTENQIEDTEEDQIKKDYLKPVLSSAMWLLSLVNDILDLAQLNAGKFQLMHSQFDIQQELIDAATMMSVQTNSKGIELKVVVDPNIPKRITSDKRRIKQVVVNLLSNAIKFTSRGGSITINATQMCGQYTEITITDTGVGIPQEDQCKLFQKDFVRIEDTANMNTEGIGLGLMICNILSLKLGQRNTSNSYDTTYGIQMFSEGKGKGSKFSFVVLDQTKVNELQKRGSSKCIIDPFLKEARATNQISQINVNFNKDSADYKAIVSSVQFSPCKTDIRTKKTKGSRFIKLTTVNFKDLNDASGSRLVYSFSITADNKPPRQSAQFEKIYIESMAGSEPNILSDEDDQSQSLAQLDHNCFQILIVDDVEINMIALRMALQKKGYTCECAYSAQEALDQLRATQECQNCSRIILMDIEMPKINGIDATRMIRTELKHKNYYIIGCSGYSGIDDKLQCMAAGMNDYIEKPIRIAELMKKIQPIFENTHGGISV